MATSRPKWLDDVTEIARQGLWKIGSWNLFHYPFGMSEAS